MDLTPCQALGPESHNSVAHSALAEPLGLRLHLSRPSSLSCRGQEPFFPCGHAHHAQRRVSAPGGPAHDPPALPGPHRHLSWTTLPTLHHPPRAKASAHVTDKETEALMPNDKVTEQAVVARTTPSVPPCWTPPAPPGPSEQVQKPAHAASQQRDPRRLTNLPGPQFPYPKIRVRTTVPASGCWG